MWAQNQKELVLDSLENILDTIQNPYKKFPVLNQLSWHATQGDRKRARRYVAIFDSLAHALEEDYYIGRAMILRGSIDFQEQDNTKAMEEFLNALEIFENRKDTAWIASLNNNIAAVLWQQKDTLNSLARSKKALYFYEFKREGRNGMQRLAFGYNNLGSIYKEVEQFDSAKHYMELAYETSLNLKDKSNLGLVCFHLGQLEYDQKNYQKSLDYLKEGIPFISPTRYISTLSDAKLLQALNQLELQKLSQAKQTLISVEEIIEENNLKINTLALYDTWALYYQKVGDFKNASLYQEKYLEKFKEDTDNEKDKNTKELLTKYETEKKELAIQQLELKEELSQTNIKNQRTIIGGLIGGLAILGFLLFKIFGQNRKISEQNTLISTALSEKELLLKEIHHRVKNNLQVISSLLGIQSRQIEDKKAKDAILEGRTRVQSMSLIHQDLYKDDNISGIYMPNYIPKLCDNLLNTYNISEGSIKMQYQIDPIKLDVDTVIPLGLIINELMSNALKYAFPNNQNGLIEVNMKEDEDSLTLEISDNGIGLDEEQLQAKSDSFGHSLIRAFKNKLKAEVRVDGTDGTSIQVEIKEFKKVN